MKKMKMKWLLPVAAVASLVACGGGSSDESQSSSATPAEALTEVKYSFPCTPVDPGNSTFAKKAEITILGSLDQPSAQVSADVRSFSDLACTKLNQKWSATGVATLSNDTKTLVGSGGVTKVGRKGQFTVQGVSLYGVTLSMSPIGQTGNFVVVQEGDNLYFGSGSRDTDGYPVQFTMRAAVRQP